MGRGPWGGQAQREGVTVGPWGEGSGGESARLWGEGCWTAGGGERNTGETDGRDGAGMSRTLGRGTGTVVRN